MKLSKNKAFTPISILKNGLIKKAFRVISDKQALTLLINKTTDLRGAAALLKEKLNTALRLLNAWRKGDYNQVSYKTVTLIVASILYLINPFDFIPDFLPVTGLIDDTALIMYVMNRIQKDIDAFNSWELTR